MGGITQHVQKKDRREDNCDIFSARDEEGRVEAMKIVFDTELT